VSDVIRDLRSALAYLGPLARAGSPREWMILELEGCLHRERARAAATKTATHGHTRGRIRSAEYIAWTAMRRRCRPDWPRRQYYFDRGIRVCPEWESSFEAFLTAVGRRPGLGHQLDRIDNDKGYEPGNVRWADLRTQRSNQRPRGRYKLRKDAGVLRGPRK